MNYLRKTHKDLSRILNRRFLPGEEEFAGTFQEACAYLRSLPQRAEMHEGSITIRLRAEVPEVERLNRVIRQFGELHEIPCRTLYAVNLAIDELVSNAILYAYDNPIGQEVTVTIEVRAGFMDASIEDGGREFDPLQAEPPDLSLPLQQRDAGGLGIHLVRSLMDEVSYRRADEKNILTMRKRMR